jgi:hypothetical protein
MTQSASEILISGFGNDAPAATAPTQPTVTALRSGDDRNPGETFTPAQQRALASDLVAAGTKTRDEVNAALAADGIQPLDDPDAPLSQAAEIDAAFPPAQPHEYIMPKLVDEAGNHGPELQRADQEIRAWLSDARMPVGVGSEILRSATEFAPRWGAMSPDQRQEHDAGVHEQLRAVWREDYGRKIDLARQLVRELEAKSPGKVIATLEVTGAGADATVIMNLADSAERLLLRKSA